MRVIYTISSRYLSIVIVVMLFSYIVCGTKESVAAVYLDGSTTGCSDGLNTYNPATRSCGNGNNTVFLTLASFNTGMVAGATNYIRAGNYYRTTNAFEGALDVPRGKNGTAANKTIVKAYTGEERQAVIATAADKFQYNPNPLEATGGSNSVKFYPNPAITIRSSYATVDGLKVYGQSVLWDQVNTLNDVTLKNCDLGGGGPSENQGQVVKLHTGYNFLVSNNKIHNSTCARAVGENDWNGAALMGYGASAIVENNEFYDNCAIDAFIKDTAGQSGRTFEIRNNYFKPSTIYNNAGAGIFSMNQAYVLSNILIHNNVFYKKTTGIYWRFSATSQNLIYNNTFINSVAFDINNEMTQAPDTLSVFNNIFYHTTSGSAFTEIYYLNNLPAANWNMYYTASGTTKWNIRYTSVATALSGWKTYSGKDAASIASDPSFINSAGTTPTDFRRASYAENFTGSPYSTKAGAYITGDEIIGFTTNASSSGTLLSPLNLIVKQITN